MTRSPLARGGVSQYQSMGPTSRCILSADFTSACIKMFTLWCWTKKRFPENVPNVFLGNGLDTVKPSKRDFLKMYKMYFVGNCSVTPASTSQTTTTTTAAGYAVLQLVLRGWLLQGPRVSEPGRCSFWRPALRVSARRASRPSRPRRGRGHAELPLVVSPRHVQACEAVRPMHHGARLCRSLGRCCGRRCREPRGLPLLGGPPAAGAAVLHAEGPRPQAQGPSSAATRRA